MKSTTEFMASWNEKKAKLKQKFAILTDNDLLLLKGKKDELLSRLQSKLGRTKQEIQRIIEGL